MQDEKNVASSDDGGEILIWDVVKGELLFRLHCFFEHMVTTMSLLVRFKRFAAASGELLKIFELIYKEDENSK